MDLGSAVVVGVEFDRCLKIVLYQYICPITNRNNIMIDALTLLSPRTTKRHESHLGRPHA